MSDVSVDIIKNRNGEAPDLPSGANISGVSTAATLQVTNLNPTHINASGITTATTFSGSMKSTGTPTLGLGVTINSSGINISGVATAGIVSATTLYGDGSNLTGVAMSIAPMSYNPDVNDTSVTKDTGIGITFTERVIAGSGNVTLRVAGAAGTVVENFGVGSSVTISNNSISIDPTSNLTPGDTYYISYPSGAFTNTGGDVSYVGTAYTFGTKPYTGKLFSWGYNSSGVLGHNNSTPSLKGYSSPTQVPGTTWLSIGGGIGGGGSALIATKSDGTLWMWGDSGSGQLGQNAPGGRSSPVQIPGTTWSENHIATEGQTSGAVKTDGTLWVWGNNSFGRLGQNQEPSSLNGTSSPIQIPGTSWSTTAGTLSSGNSIFAIKTDGTGWAWGRNNYGSVGLNQPTNTHYSSPVQIPGTTWKQFSASNYNSAAVKTDGTLWVWGFGTNGRLGLNVETATCSSPTQIPGTTWKQIANGYEHMLAVKTDGTLWAWGDNSNGALGLNQDQGLKVSSPAQIPGTTWAYVGTNIEEGTIASKTDGTLWTWGSSTYGQLGLNAFPGPNRSSPTQIPGTNWSTEISKLGVGQRHFAIIQAT